MSPLATILEPTSPPRSGPAAVTDVEGYRVDGPDGRIGVAVRFHPPDSGQAGSLVVAYGLFIRRVLVVAGSEIATVDHQRRRITVKMFQAEGALVTEDMVVSTRET